MRRQTTLRRPDDQPQRICEYSRLGFRAPLSLTCTARVPILLRIVDVVVVAVAAALLAVVLSGQNRTRKMVGNWPVLVFAILDFLVFSFFSIYSSGGPS